MTFSDDVQTTNHKEASLNHVKKFLMWFCGDFRGIPAIRIEMEGQVQTGREKMQSRSRTTNSCTKQTWNRAMV